MEKGMPIVIQIETISKQNGEVINYSEQINGQLVEIGTNLYIRYKEKNNQTNGAMVTFKITKDNEVQLTRQQEGMRLRLNFIAQKRIPTTYKTPYGIMAIETMTTNLKIITKDSPMSAKLEVDYLLYSQEKIVGDYKIRLQFTA